MRNLFQAIFSQHCAENSLSVREEKRSKVIALGVIEIRLFMLSLLWQQQQQQQSLVCCCYCCCCCARSGQIENYLMVQWLPLSAVAETEATVKRAPSAGQAEQMRKLPASKFIEVYRLGPSPGLIVDVRV